MQTVDEQPETIHLYVVRENEPKPSFVPIILSALALLLVVVVSAVSPYQQPVTRAVIRVPAVLLPIRTFTVAMAILPTGVKVYPAVAAHGILTITNGSVISQTIPQGFRLGNVATDSSVFVPAGSANGFGYAVVTAHMLLSGKSGNIPAYTINQVEGSSVFIRNLSAFYGGRDGYSVKVITAQDRSVAIASARKQLLRMSIGLRYSCVEAILRKTPKYLLISWRCQMLTYHIASFYHVTAVRIIGKNLLISVWFVARPARIWVK
jgi:hypothetical protein